MEEFSFERGERDFDKSKFVLSNTVTLASLDWPKWPGRKPIKRKIAASTPNNEPDLCITADNDCERTCPMGLRSMIKPVCYDCR